MELLYVTFYTSSEAVATEYTCKKEKVTGKLISVPRELSSGCGMAFESSKDNFKIITALLKDNDIEYEKIVLLNR